jgi:hypothetical protein
MKSGFLDLLDLSNDPEFFWQVRSGPPVLCHRFYEECDLKLCYALWYVHLLSKLSRTHSKSSNHDFTKFKLLLAVPSCSHLFLLVE